MIQLYNTVIIHIEKKEVCPTPFGFGSCGRLSSGTFFHGTRGHTYLFDESDKLLKIFPNVAAPRPRTGADSAGANFYMSVHSFFSSLSLSSNSARCSVGTWRPSTLGRYGS